MQSRLLHYSWLEDKFTLRRGDQAAIAAAPCHAAEEEEEEVEEVVKMMYGGVLVDGLTVGATVAVVHIDINSHGELATVVTTAASVQARPYILRSGFGREVILVNCFEI